MTRVTRGKVTLDMSTSDLSHSILAAREGFVEPARQKGIALQIAVPDRSFVVSADANCRQQILRNVLSNALKFTPAGGGVTVTLGEEGDRRLLPSKIPVKASRRNFSHSPLNSSGSRKWALAHR